MITGNVAQRKISGLPGLTDAQKRSYYDRILKSENPGDVLKEAQKEACALEEAQLNTRIKDHQYAAADDVANGRIVDFFDDIRPATCHVGG